MGSSTDRQYLELHGNQYRVTYGVPADVRKELGSRLKRALGTDSLSKANQLKWSVIQEFKAIIAKTRGLRDGERNALISEAVEVAVARRRMSEREEDSLNQDVRQRVYEILGAPERVEVDSNGSPHDIFPPEKRVLANEYEDVAAGSSLPLRIHYDDYSANVLKHLKPRTIDDDHRAIDTFERWCTKRHIRHDLRDITTRVAKRFADELGTFEGNIEPITCSKYIGRLRQYWERIVYLETVPSNPWLAVKIRIPETKHEERERPFTDDEVRRLLTGNCLQHLKDLMYIGALTGARLDAIVDLKVKHALDGHFTFKRQKLEKSSRDVPIHSALKEIVDRRTIGKDSEAWFFPEYPPPKEGSIKEHSSTATKAFTLYRRKLKVDDVVEGKRRALINFHSFRRWFVTKAERAGQKDTIIAAVVGHTREGITLSKYSAGPEMGQAKRVVESVKLPPLGQDYVPEPRAITPRKR